VCRSFRDLDEKKGIVQRGGNTFGRHAGIAMPIIGKSAKSAVGCPKAQAKRLGKGSACHAFRKGLKREEI